MNLSLNYPYGFEQKYTYSIIIIAIKVSKNKLFSNICMISNAFFGISCELRIYIYARDFIYEKN